MSQGRSVRPDRARVLRANPTDVARRLWYHLRKRRLGGHRFRRQLPLGPYVVDLACIERSLIVEVDGGRHSDRRLYDEARAAWLETGGWRVVRFWNNEVTESLEGVLERLLEALEPRAGSPLPALPRKRRREENS